MEFMQLSSEVLKAVAALAVAVLGPFISKKLHDRDLREKIAQAADAALVLTLHALRNQKLADLGELVREVVKHMLDDPSAPKQLRQNETLRLAAAAAAIARAGLVGVQAMQMNADGTAVPVTQLPRP